MYLTELICIVILVNAFSGYGKIGVAEYASSRYLDWFEKYDVQKNSLSN